MKKTKNKLIDLIVQKKLDDYQCDVWYCSNIFMIFSSLPTHKLKGNPVYWKKNTPLCELTIMRNDRFEIPYGCYVRMNQIFINTEVNTKKKLYC